MEFMLNLENFEGPMDLLLHLVKETKLDIYEINIKDIIDKYLLYIKTMKEFNIDLSSSFLVMACTLIHLKSKKLIGKTKEEETEEDLLFTSEEDLKEKLIMYEQYKNMSEEFKILEEKRSNVYTKLPENLNNYTDNYCLVNDDGLSKIDLFKAMQMVLERLEYKEPKQTKITKKEISVASRKIWIRKILENKDKCDFLELFEVPNKDCIIATFLAVLDMSREHLIKITQEKNFANILIWRI